MSPYQELFKNIAFHANPGKRTLLKRGGGAIVPNDLRACCVHFALIVPLLAMKERRSPGASPGVVLPSKSKALCILQQCCTPKKSRSSSTIWTKYNAAVKQRECIIPDLWEYYCRTAGPSYNISQLKLFYVRNMKRLMAA